MHRAADRRHGARGSLLLAATRWGAAFLLALGFSSAAIRAIAPEPFIPQISEKLAQFSRGSHDTIFLGSSKIYNGIVPDVFDSTLQRRGWQANSFNLGVDGMGFPERVYLCERALARKPGGIRWVFVELTGVRTYIPEGQRGTRRLTQWHDARRTAMVCRALLRGGEKAQQRGSRLELGTAHVSLFFRRALNLGEGAELLQPTLLGRKGAEGRDAFDPRLRGYLPLHRQIEGRELKKFQKGLARFASPREPADSFSEEEWLRFSARVAAAGAKLFAVVTPSPDRTRTFFSRDREDEQTPPVFAYDDPVKFPHLYEADRRGDPVHLSDRGAHEFTTLLAEDFAAYLEAQRKSAAPHPSSTSK